MIEIMTQDEVWQLIAQNERLLKREIRRRLPAERRDELDEMYSDVVISRAHAIMETYDPSRNVLPITHLCANIRWYAHKWVHRRCYKYVPPPVDLTEHDSGDDGATVKTAETIAEVSLVLDSLPKEAANILRWHLLQNCTLREIADHYDPPLTIGQMKTRYQEALELARELCLA